MLWTEDQQKAFWEGIDTAGAALVTEICDYCKAAGYNAEDDSVAACIDGLFHKLLDNGGRPLHHFARGDLIRHIRRQNMDDWHLFIPPYRIIACS